MSTDNISDVGIAFLKAVSPYIQASCILTVYGIDAYHKDKVAKYWF